jgi:regulatory protein
MSESNKTVEQKVYDKALVFLKIRPHSSSELRRKLIMRGFDKNIIEQTLLTLTSEGLINDEQFARAYLDSLVRFKTFGFYGLLAKLAQRGVERNYAEQLLRENFGLADEKEIALRVVEKDRKGDKLKLMQKLSRKGFRSEVIREIVK